MGKGKGPLSPEAIAMRRVVRESDPRSLDSSDILPEEDTGERQYFLFYQDEGGLRATDEANASLDTIYYLGIIDILTPYTTFKKVEHFFFHLIRREDISVVVRLSDNHKRERRRRRYNNLPYTSM